MQEKFAPTLDWGNELWTSLIWIGRAWLIAAAVTLIICFLLGRFTTWGRQFWRITGAYFTGAESVKVWVWLGGLLLLVVAGVRLDVLFTYQSSDMLTAFQAVAAGIATGDEAVKESGAGGFWMSLGIFSILAAIFIARLLLDLYLWQRFCLAWRAWLTDRLTGDWLDGKAYYRARFISDKIDNPDQRIQFDIDIFTANKGPLPNVPYTGTESTLLFGAINAVLSVISFTAILWDLSGPMTLPLVGYELPRAMFWIGIVFVLVVSVIAFWLGRPIIWLSFANEKFNAAFRYALVRLRDASEAVAFYRGEVVERTGLRKLFAPVVSNYKRYLGRSRHFQRVELVDEPGHRALAVHFAIPEVLQRRDHSRRDEPILTGVLPDPDRVVVVPERLRPLRRLSGGDHSTRRLGDRQRRRQSAAGRSRQLPARTARSNSTTSRCARPTGNSSSSRSISA